MSIGYGTQPGVAVGGISFDVGVSVNQALIRSGAATIGALTGNNTSIPYWSNAGANLTTNIFFCYAGIGDATGSFLGVGTTSPTAKGHFVGLSNSPATPIFIIESIGSQAPLYFSSGGASAYIKGDNGGNFAMGAQGFIAYEAGGFGAPFERMRVTASGNVGIGTTTPHSRLAVLGLQTFANNAAAIAGGLAVGDFYITGADPDFVCVVH